jgi:hypothetical protein
MKWNDWKKVQISENIVFNHINRNFIMAVIRTESKWLIIYMKEDKNTQNDR